MDCFASLAMTVLRHCEEQSDEAIHFAVIPGPCQEVRPGMTAIYSSTKVAVSAMLAREVR